RAGPASAATECAVEPGDSSSSAAAGATASQAAAGRYLHQARTDAVMNGFLPATGSGSFDIEAYARFGGTGNACPGGPSPLVRCLGGGASLSWHQAVTSSRRRRK